MREVKPFHESVVETTKDSFSEFYMSFGQGLNFLSASSKLLITLDLISKLIEETVIPEKEFDNMIEEFESIAADFEEINHTVFSVSLFVDTKEIKARLANIVSCLKLKCEHYSSC